MYRFYPSKGASTSITDVIKENYNKPWLSWMEIKKDKDLKKMMFDRFRVSCFTFYNLFSKFI